MLHHDPAEDTELFDSLIRGEQQAFALVYNKYASELLAYTRRKISVREDCEEIVQEVFESLWLRHGSLRNEGLRFYLFRAAENKVIRYFQRSKVRLKYAEHFLLFQSVYTQWEEADDKLDYESSLEWIDKKLSTLPERWQEAFRFKLYNNLSNDEIAQRMNIDKSIVQNYLYRAKDHLRKSYRKLVKISAFLLGLLIHCF